MAKRENGVPAQPRQPSGNTRFQIATLGPQAHAVMDTREVDEHEHYLVFGTYRSVGSARRIAREEEAAAAARGE